VWVGRFEHVRNAVPEIAARILEANPSPCLVRIEGVDGSGKSTLARELARHLSGLLIHGDDYIVPSEDEKPYSSCIRLDALRADLRASLSTSQIVVADAVCLGELAPEAEFGRGYKIYLKRLSFNVPGGIWHGFDPYDATPEWEIARSVYLYHAHYRPHETADVIIELPESGHTLQGPNAPPYR
jgi:hypothetical protein